MSYPESDFLQLSGIQHFSFCRRQWALIHIEQLWAENFLTTDGAIMHEKTHDSSSREVRGDLMIMRGLYIHSVEMGISGQCDVVEFHRNENGIILNNREGKWIPFPVEYKRGASKSQDADRLQLCAQAMCLEEMLCCQILEGALFYGQMRRRERVVFSKELRDKVISMTEEMHMLFKRGYTPIVKKHKGCISCSLKDLCLPEMARGHSVSSYLKSGLGEEE